MEAAPDGPCAGVAGCGLHRVVLTGSDCLPRDRESNEGVFVLLQEPSIFVRQLHADLGPLSPQSRDDDSPRVALFADRSRLWLPLRIYIDTEGEIPRDRADVDDVPFVRTALPR